MCAPLIPLVILHFDSFERNEQIASITPDFNQELSCGLLQLRLILSCGWLDFRGPTRVSVAAYDLRLSRVQATGFKLRLSRVPVTGYKLRPTPFYGRLEFQRLDTSCGCLKFRQLVTSYGWLRPMPDSSSGGWIPAAAVSSSGGWIHVTADSILQLILLPAAEYEFLLTPSYSWL